MDPADSDRSKDQQPRQQQQPGQQQQQRRRQKIADKDSLSCQVCGDKANGYNFGAIACESCKAFFRRNALKHQDLRCTFEGNCKIDPFTRKFCTACRLKRCSDINMKKEWILDEASLKKRKKLLRRRPGEEQPKDAANAGETVQSLSNVSSTDATPSACVSSTSPCESSRRHPLPSTSRPTTTSPPATPAALGTRRSLASEKYEASSSTNESSLASSASGSSLDLVPLSEEDSLAVSMIMQNHMLTINPVDQQSWTRMTIPSAQAHDAINMADCFIRRLIKFLKTIPEFLSLCQDDQVALLKGGIMETLVIRSAITFDSGIGGFKVESPSSSEQHQLKLPMIFQGLGKDILEEHMKFIVSFNTIAMWNKSVIVLAMLINVFSPDRPGLRDKGAVAAAEEHYAQLLLRYLHSLHPPAEAAAIYPRLLMKLTDARTYGELSSMKVAQVNASDMEPLMREIFNVS